jgi:ketosteroid isomerase-like protein
VRTPLILASALLGSLGLLALAGPGGSARSGPSRSEVDTIADMLDDFHDAAAKADERRYFAHFAEGAVFLGTDPTERWTVEEFRAWAARYFQGESAWVYHAVERHVRVADGGEVGWFDEVVRNEKYGDLRGTGVVLREGGAWKLAQYNLTFLIPNDDASAVLEIIRHD